MLLLAGWGLVGLSSYLLIGFWHERPEPVAAAKKAFVMNAIGDVGIAIAIFFMVRDLGTTDFHDGVPHGAQRRVAEGHRRRATGSPLALLLGRRRQVGPDPAPHLASRRHGRPDARVSALIHAATMVTAGVYLVARTPRAVRERAGRAQALVALIGLATLLMAGVIALVQTDIKRIIAYSTMSQIGYMFAAVGRGRRTRPACSTCSPTRSSRRCCSSAPASSSTRSPTSRTCAGWAAWLQAMPRTTSG